MSQILPVRSHRATVVLAAAALLSPIFASAQSSSAANSDRWLHVRVISSDSKGETVRVNVPLEMAEKVLPAINKDRLHNGKVKFDDHEMNGVDIKALLDAVRSSKDGEYVTVQGSDNDVRVAKQNGYMFVHVTDKSSHEAGKHGKSSDRATVEVKIPMKVVDALFSAGKDELDVLAGLRALSAHGDTELVSVKSDDNTVRVWLDSKNVSD
jgi:WD40 repeat protein